MRIPKSEFRKAICYGLLLFVAALTAGCLEQPTNPNASTQEKDILAKIPTIGDITIVGNIRPIQVTGVGLVTGLKGKGAAAAPGDYRKMLEKYLRQKQIANVSGLLNSTDTAMVLVTGLIPPGARRGDRFDVVVTLPRGSKVESLRGGLLETCFLRNHDTRKHLSSTYQGPNGILQGHILAQARGLLVVGLGGDESTRNGKIFDGGATFINRPYFFELKKDSKSARFAYSVMKRLNTMFQDDFYHKQTAQRLKRLMMLKQVNKRLNDKLEKELLAGADIARPAGKSVVAVNVPREYRLNHKRFLRVTRLIPLAASVRTNVPYRQRLRAMLHEPGQSHRAALRLEALGKQSVPVLKTGLVSDNAFIRFCSAEALAYLGDASGVNELAGLADRHSQLRAYCLTALASVDEPFTHSKLTELMSSSNAETRYGAFRALQILRSRNPEVRGELLGDAFRLHRVAVKSEALVHYSLQRDAEVVLFGRTARLKPPFRIRAGKRFNVVAAPDDDRCTITLFDLNHPDPVPTQCSLRLEDVLRTMAKIGAVYVDVVDLLQEIEDRRCLTAPIAADKMPQPMPISDIAKGAANNPDFLGPPSSRVRASINLPPHFSARIERTAGRGQ